MFIGFVVAYDGFIWFYWLQSMLKFNVLDFSTANQWEVTKTIFFLISAKFQRNNAGEPP